MDAKFLKIRRGMDEMDGYGLNKGRMGKIWNIWDRGDIWAWEGAAAPRARSMGAGKGGVSNRE
jgi:hypothetical protein